MENTNAKYVKLFKALSDESRVTVLRMLQQGEKCACHLQEELVISQPTLSHHMKILCDAGVVNCRKEGKWSHYSINKDTCRVMDLFLSDLLDASEDTDDCMSE